MFLMPGVLRSFIWLRAKIPVHTTPAVIATLRGLNMLVRGPGLSERGGPDGSLKEWRELLTR